MQHKKSEQSQSEPKIKPLTYKEQKLYDFINNRRNWRPPAWSQMRTYMNCKHDESVRSFLKSIEKKGHKIPKQTLLG